MPLAFVEGNMIRINVTVEVRSCGRIADGRYKAKVPAFGIEAFGATEREAEEQAVAAAGRIIQGRERGLLADSPGHLVKRGDL